MEQLKLKPQLQTFQAWLWDSATNCLCTKDYHGSEIMSLWEALLTAAIVGVQWNHHSHQNHISKSLNFNPHMHCQTGVDELNDGKVLLKDDMGINYIPCRSSFICS
ncbi:uncharacterized protein [Pyrus communis]|uniref:uncharacterized protein isoform X2 n=1 Tax=Pyrus communis TaxID=23211 RepID=UPI0035BEEA1F